MDEEIQIPMHTTLAIKALMDIREGVNGRYIFSLINFEEVGQQEAIRLKWLTKKLKITKRGRMKLEHIDNHTKPL